MYPSEITQAERQLVLYKTNAYYYSRYATQTQKTTVTLPTDRAESYTQTPKPVAKNEQAVVYGPYENVAALSRSEISLHYENNNPFLTVSNLNRWIEVSHWGNIAVEETVDMYHSGAKLKGSFSRLDFQRRQDSYSAVKTFKVKTFNNHNSVIIRFCFRHHYQPLLAIFIIGMKSAMFQQVMLKKCKIKLKLKFVLVFHYMAVGKLIIYLVIMFHHISIYLTSKIYYKKH